MAGKEKEIIDIIWPIMAEKYSNGSRGDVFFLNPKEKMFFPRADLVKGQLFENDRDFFIEFYVFKIANLLFPNSFINIPAEIKTELPADFTAIFDTSRPQIKKYHYRKYYSVMASTPSEHAILSAHKENPLCNCGACLNHASFHTNNHLGEKAFTKAEYFSMFGINVPWDDITDYCLDSSGNLVFFEINQFHPDKLERRLKTVKKKGPNLEHVMELLNHYKDLQSGTNSFN